MVKSERFCAIVAGMSAALGVVGSAILVAMLLIVTANVLLRYGFNAPIGWADQVTAYGLVYVTFLGAPFALAQRAHVAVDILHTLLRPQSGRRLYVWLDVVGSLYCAAFTFLAVKEVIRVIERGSQFADAIVVPQWVVLIAIPLSSFLLTVQFIANLFTDLARARQVDQPPMP